jgi:SAM-dependent methyltransferase/DTW domain-containing protein YfiP
MPVDWDHRYSSTGKYVYGKDPNACVVEAFERRWLPGQGRVLLIGEGEGRNAVYLASKGFECVASDPSKRALEKAEKLAAARNVRIQTLKADALEALATGPYDVIVSVFCAYSSSEERKEAHAAIGKALQPGGRYLYVGFGSEHNNIENAVPGPGSDRLASVDTIKKELGLDVVEACERERDLFEGSFHRGRASIAVVCASVPQRRPQRLMFAAAVDQCAACDDVKWKTGDALLDKAPELARCTMRHAAKTCGMCWSRPCACAELFDAPVECAPKLVVVAHPSELMRTTASAPLIPMLLQRSVFTVWGVHTGEVDSALQSGASVLFPSDEALTISSSNWRGTILVPDGSWQRATAVVEALEKRASFLGLPKPKRLQLSEASIKSMHSPLVDALHEGSGPGRCSTAEAVALACNEGGDAKACSMLTEATKRLASKITSSLPKPPPSRSSQGLPPRAYDEKAWVNALAGPARAAPLVNGVRRCVVCGAGLARADALQNHVRGQRHRACVARNAFDDGAIVGPPCNESAAKVFRDFSTLPLSDAPREPPDVALAEVIL